ncbi:MAG: penicillin-binding protein 2 [Candidatus Moranbacteria bacterium]|nr:penicillin-binding protein 2 [Candidatus Moranbacteria bacterium]
MNKTKMIKRTSQSSHQTSEKNWRINGLVFFIFFIAFSIVGKLYFLQVARHGAYVALAENQHSSSTEIQAKRGEIFLQDEGQPYPLAVNRQLQMVYAVPREMKDTNGAVETLSSILNLDKNFLKDKFSNPEDMFEILKHKLSDDESQKIREAKIAGIYLTPENFRYYPAGELASQVVGFVGSGGDGPARGMYGLEASWEKKLHGQSGMLEQEGDSRGRWIAVSDRNVQEAQDGPDLILTINHTVQFEVEKILKQTMEKFSADSASIIVEDPKTGKILAMANQPSFNPNDFASTEDISRFSNPTVSEPYESGSVFKAFTEAIGIDDGKIEPDTTYTDTGAVQEAGYEIHNSDMKANGVQTMTQVLEKSLNTGVIYIEKLVGNKTFADYVDKFGFGEKTNVDLPGEVPGNTRNLSNPKTTINFFTASFGQGISVTPLQLAAGYSVLANKGTLMKPQIVDKLQFSDGHTEAIEPQEVRQVISASTADKMGQMLRDVVTNGHGKRADVPGFLVGGKTGTAQIAKAGAKGYEEGVNIGSFAGYAPINDPQFVVIVKIVNPKGVEWAESSAAPTFGSVMKFLLEYYKVKPTEDPTTSPMYKTYQNGADPLAIQPVAAVSAPAPAPAPAEDKKSKKSDAKIITSGD